MKSAAFVFPHQLFSQQPVLRYRPEKVYLIEDSLFFGDAAYPMKFHKVKLAYHLATMDAYARRLEKREPALAIVRYDSAGSRLGDVFEALAADDFRRVLVVDVHDFMLEKRLRRHAMLNGIVLEILDTPAFINTPAENRAWRADRERWYMADFYRWQRRRLGILMTGDEPAGGRWSFDEENRRKLPKRLLGSLPALPEVRRQQADRDIIGRVETDFTDNPGALEQWLYPTTYDSADRWLEEFLASRFEHFGTYEDAMVAGEPWLYHSVLTPMLNVGLLTPRQVVDRAIEAAEEYAVPLNSVEGFVRQIIGWREFMRATYDDLGVPMRTTNYWQHTRPLPDSLYTGDTGIAPLDDVIRRVLETGYCHHIERLMIIGGFLFLAEIDPDAIYRWFMEMFIDSYDWVMVPNVYAMSQNADGGAITTKPYFSGSNYVRKMSNHVQGEWCAVWDGLFWRWIWNHRESLADNPRWSMMCRNVERMASDKRRAHFEAAERFLDVFV